MTQVSDLSELSLDEVSPVHSGAIRKKFCLLKADEQGDLELSKPTVDAMATPLDDEDALVEQFTKSGMDEPQREAALVIARLAKGFGFDASAAFTKWTEQQHTPAELASIRAGSVPDLQGAGEDDDDEDENDEFVPQETLANAASLEARILKSLEAIL